MALVRWDPLQELAAFERRIDQLLGRSSAGQTGMWSPALDVRQEGDTMIINAELPGIDPSDIEITVEDDVLTLSGSRDDERQVSEGDWLRKERVSGRFQRSVSLPGGVDPDTIEARANHGVIEIKIPRPAPPSPHRIELRGNGGAAKEVGVSSSAGTGGQPQGRQPAQPQGEGQTRPAEGKAPSSA